jgi:polyisoprenoid-binding protein YceI
MPRLTEDFGTPSRRAAVEKLSVSTTATKSSRSFKSTVPISEQSNPNKTIVSNANRSENDLHGGMNMTTATWTVDNAHSSIRFGVRHLVIAKVRGQFRKWSAELALDESDLTRSSVAVSIDTKSVDTGNPQRDADLVKGHFFAAEEFPTMTFQSRRIERTRDDDAYRAIGDLTLRGVTKEVPVDVELGGFVTDPWGNHRTGFSVSARVKRSDFGMTWNQALETGGVVIGDDVDVAIDLEAFTQSAKAKVAGLKKMFADTAADRARRQKEKPLYQRLGGREPIRGVVRDIIDLHFAEATTKPLMTGVDHERLVGLVTDWLCEKAGGPEKYTGRDMVTAHAHLKMTDEHFLAAGDQIMRSLKKHGVPDLEAQEVICAIIAHHDDVIR